MLHKRSKYDKANKTASKPTKAVIFLISLLVSTAVTTVFNIAKDYLWENKQRELATNLSISHILGQVIFFESMLQKESSLFVDLEVPRGATSVVINNLMLPNTNFWHFYDFEISGEYGIKSKLLPPECILKIASYLRYASLAKHNFYKAKSDITSVLNNGIKMKGLMTLLPDVDEKAFQKAFTKVHVAQMMLNVLKLKYSLLWAITSGYEAAASLSERVLDERALSAHYLAKSKAYLELAAQEDQRIKKATKVVADESRKLFQQAYRLVPQDIQDILMESIKKYAEPLPTKP